MTSNDLDFVNYKNIKNLTVDVSSEISSRNLKEFIKTSIEINTKDNILKSKVFVQFLQKVNKYEIYLYPSSSKLPIPQEIFHNKLTTSKYNLFITKDFFTIYYENKFYFSKNNYHYSNSDILNYLQFSYKIDLNLLSVHNINDDEFKSMKNDFLKDKKQSSLKYIDFTINNNYKYYLIYIISLFILLILYFGIYQKQTITSLDESTALKDIKAKYYKALLNKYKQKKFVTNELIEMFNTLSKYNITLNNLRYKKRYFLNIQTKKKENLYKFARLYKSKMKKIIHKKKIYIMEVEIEF